MRLRSSRVKGLIAILAGGVCLQIGSCASYLAGLNPCLSLLVCDPVLYDFVQSGIEGPGTDPSKDPFCTFPPYCGPEQDPIYGTIFGEP